MDPVALLKKLDEGNVSNIIPEVKAAVSTPGCSALAHRLIVRIANLTLMKKNGSSEPILSKHEEIVQLALFCSQAILSESGSDVKINSNSRTIVAVLNILTRFSGKNDILSAVRMLNAFLPILEKMSSSFSVVDKNKINKYVVALYTLLVSVNDSVYKDDNSELSPLYLWELMLRVSSLAKNFDLMYVLYVLRNMTAKYERLHLNNAEQISAFNMAVIEKLLQFSKTNCLKVVDHCSDVNKVFGTLVTLLTELLTSDLKGTNKANAHCTLSNMSKFVELCFAEDLYHLNCFRVISRLFKNFHFPINLPPEENLFISEMQALLEILKKEIQPLHSSFTWVVHFGGWAFTSMDHSTRVSDFKNNFSIVVFSSIHHFAQYLSKLLLSFCHSVCTGNDGKVCPYTGDAVLAFKGLKKFVSLCVDCKKDGEEWSEVLPMVKDSCDNLELIIRKASEEKCVKEQLLKTALYDVYYSLGHMCYSTCNWKYGLTFFERQTREMLVIDQEISAANAKKLSSILPRLAICYEKLELMKQAKVALMLDVILHFKCNISQSKFTEDKWATLQDGSGDAKTADKLLSDETLLKSICPQFRLSKQLVPQIMLWELSCYAANRMKTTDVILNAWSTLKESKPSALQLLEGSALVCQALFYANDSVSWCGITSASISSWLSQVRPEEKAVALCALGAHYHTKFLVMAQKHFDENHVDVKVYRSNPAYVKTPQDVCDPADVCQVGSSFPNLNLHREQKLMDLLDAAVNFWNSSLENGLSVTDYSSSSIVAASGDYLLNIAFLYCLWGHNSAAATAFQVCCTFARKMSLDYLLIQALSGLMNTIEVSKEYILEAENLLECLKDHPKISYFRKVYCTGRAFQALRTGSFLEGSKVLQDIIDSIPTPSTLWCYAYAKTLEASYQFLPSSKCDNSKRDGSDLVRSGLSCILQNIQNKRLSQSPLTFAAVVHQALCSSLWIGRYYLHRHMPREARCFLGAELILALKLGLATRAAEFICELALVDLLTENVDEAVAKISDLKCIVDDKCIPSEDDCGESTFKMDETVFPENSSPVPKHTNTNLGCSPALEKNENFEIPILKHSLSCKCYMCRNVSVQIVWLMYGRIQAKINALRFCVHDSHATYKQIFKSADMTIKRLCANVVSQGASLQQHQLTSTLICSKLEFVDMLVMYGKDKDAQRENERIFTLLNNLLTDENNLTEDTKEQRICITEILERNEGKAKSPRLLNRTPEANKSQITSSSTFIDKTPEMKELAVTPTGPGKRRPPLKQLIKSPNRLLKPLTDQQFYSPKVSRDLENLIGSDDDVSDRLVSVPSKENVSHTRLRQEKASCNKPEFLDKASVATSLPGGQEILVDGIKNVTTSKASKSIRPSKSKTVSATGETFIVQSKSSSLRPASKPLHIGEKPPSSRGTFTKSLPVNEKPPSSVSETFTVPGKSSSLRQTSQTVSARDKPFTVQSKSSSLKPASKPLRDDENPPSSRGSTSKSLPINEKPPSSGRTTSKTLPAAERPSRRIPSTNSKALSARTEVAGPVSEGNVRQTRQRRHL